MPQTIHRGSKQPEPRWQREISPGAAVLAGVVLLLFILFLVHQFITPIFPQKRISQEQHGRQSNRNSSSDCHREDGSHPHPECRQYTCRHLDNPCHQHRDDRRSLTEQSDLRRGSA